MIGLSRLKRAIGDVPTGGMQTGDPKVRLKLCDAQRLEVEFNAIIAERDAALAKNAELVAQVGRMQTFIRMSADKWKNTPELEPTFLNLLRVANQQPEEALREICAEAGRAGFVEASQYNFTVVSDHFINGHADEYAERVKAGEV